MSLLVYQDDFYYYFYIQISSLIGIAEKERFYQPYQIWIIQRMFDSPYLSAAKKDKKHLTKTIDKCYNNPKYFQIQAGIDLMSTARHVLQDQTYKLSTDGRRIVVDKNSMIQKSRDEESIQLLKKITDMEIDDFPSKIIEEIKNTWEY